MSIEQSLIDHCAPTLASLKTGSLFSFLAPATQELRSEIHALNRFLIPKGLRLCLLKALPGRSLCYLYRESHLTAALSKKENALFLSSCGYDRLDTKSALQTLTERLADGDSFPHEIGLFLGYPLGDVLGFIEHKGKNCLCCGLWKSYTDPCAAQKCFARCAKCTAVYSRLYKSGRPLSKLTVAQSVHATRTPAF